MLSRVAESLFWMGRYLERAEDIACALDVNFHVLLDISQAPSQESANSWEPLIQVGGDVSQFNELYDSCNMATVTDYLVLNQDNTSSIASCIIMARENARGMIEAISSEMWEQINNLYHHIKDATAADIHKNPYMFYKEVRTGVQLFHGITDCTLSRNEGWDFVQAGKYLERADNTARLIDVKYALLRQTEPEMMTSTDIIQWMAVLKSCSAFEAFRKIHLSRIDPDTILHFLMFDRDFPRSIYFSIAATQSAMASISGNTDRRSSNNVDRAVGKLEADLSFLTLEDIYAQGLHEYVSGLQRSLSMVGETIHQTYFAYHAPVVDMPQFAPANHKHKIERSIWSQAQQQQQ